MSLTRIQWEDMWNSIIKIENQLDNLFSDSRSFINRDRAFKIRIETKKIKQQIESVIGQQK